MTLIMADNYLEKKMEALQARKAKEARAKQIAWKKRMEAYRKRLEAERAAGGAGDAGGTGGVGAKAAGGGPEKSV